MILYHGSDTDFAPKRCHDCLLRGRFMDNGTIDLLKEFLTAGRLVQTEI
jgi:hypothetical protein